MVLPEVVHLKRSISLNRLLRSLKKDRAKIFIANERYIYVVYFIKQGAKISNQPCP